MTENQGVEGRWCWGCPTCGNLLSGGAGACVGEGPDKYHDPTPWKLVAAVPCDTAAVDRAVEKLALSWPDEFAFRVHATYVAEAVLRAAADPSPPTSDPEGERLADGSRPYPKSSSEEA